VASDAPNKRGNRRDAYARETHSAHRAARAARRSERRVGWRSARPCAAWTPRPEPPWTGSRRPRGPLPDPPFAATGGRFA